MIEIDNAILIGLFGYALFLLILWGLLEVKR